MEDTFSHVILQVRNKGNNKNEYQTSWRKFAKGLQKSDLVCDTFANAIEYSRDAPLFSRVESVRG